MYPTLSHIFQDLTGWSFPCPIPTFGFFVAIALMVSHRILARELRRKFTLHLVTGYFTKGGAYVKPEDIAVPVLLRAIVFGIIGARVFSILEYPEPFLEAPFYVLFSNSGFTFYGGFIFATIAVLIYARKRKLKIIHLLDAAAPALLIGYAIGRLGCHFSGDGDWGIYNISQKPNWLGFLPDWLWAYNYPQNVINEGIPISGCVGEFCSVLPVPVFPTPLYEAFFCGLAFVIFWNKRQKIKIPGLLFSFYLIISGIERFLIEQIRVDADYTFFNWKFKQAEFIALITIIAGIIIAYFVTQRYKKRTHQQTDNKINVSSVI